MISSVHTTDHMRAFSSPTMTSLFGGKMSLDDVFLEHCDVLSAYQTFCL